MELALREGSLAAEETFLLLARCGDGSVGLLDLDGDEELVVDLAVGLYSWSTHERR